MEVNLKNRISIAELFFSTLFGIIFGILGLGSIKYLNPNNIDWIKGDNLTSYIAQIFYVSDKWHYPLLFNPNYGTELSTSLTYTGPASPILLIQKLFLINPLFQFYGLWVVLNVILQLLLAIKIAKLLQFSKVQKYSLSLLTLTPFLFFRMEMHFWLISHFLILWAILNLIRYHKKINLKIVNLSANIVFAYLVNTYIFAMIFYLYLTIALHKIICDKSRNSRYYYFFALVTTSLVSIFIFDGFKRQKNTYETIKMFLSSTYGYHPSNILTWINPSTGLLVESKGIQNGFDVTNYSLFGINLGNIPGDYEGYNYLGIGNIIIIILALIFMYQARMKFWKNLMNSKYLLISAFFIFAFSISYRIGLGATEFVLPFPIYLKWILGTFRSSGRFLWIISYCIIILAALVIVQTSRIRRKTASIILAICAIFNLFEISVIEFVRYKKIEATVVNPELKTNVPLDFKKIVKKGSLIKIFPQGDVLDNNYANLNYWAWKEDAKTNILYTSRINMKEMYRIEQKTYNELCSGNLLNKDIIVVQKEKLSNFESCDLSKIQSTVIGNQIFFYNESNDNVN